MKRSRQKMVGLVLAGLFMFSTRFVFAQNTISINMGGKVNESGVVNSSIWNSFYKGNSGLLLDNNSQLTTCYLNTNITKTISALHTNEEHEMLLNVAGVSADKQVSVSVKNIPYDAYNVWVYYANNTTDEALNVTVDGNSKNISGTWDGSVSASNYAMFSGLSGSDIDLVCNGTTGPSAIQIVEVNTGNLLATEVPSVSENPAFNVKVYGRNLSLAIRDEWTGEFNLNLFTSNGKQVKIIKLNKTDKVFTQELGLNDLQEGIYVLSITSGEGISYSDKLILK